MHKQKMLHAKKMISFRDVCLNATCPFYVRLLIGCWFMTRGVGLNVLLPTCVVYVNHKLR